MAYDERHSECFLQDYSAHLYLKYEEYLLCHNFCAVFMTAIVSRSGHRIYQRFIRNFSAIIENLSHSHIQGYFRMNMGMAEVFYDGRKVSAEALINAVVEAGNDGRHKYRAEVVAK